MLLGLYWQHKTQLFVALFNSKNQALDLGQLSEINLGVNFDDIIEIDKEPSFNCKNQNYLNNKAKPKYDKTFGFINNKFCLILEEFLSVPEDIKDQQIQILQGLNDCFLFSGNYLITSKKDSQWLIVRDDTLQNLYHFQFIIKNKNCLTEFQGRCRFKNFSAIFQNKKDPCKIQFQYLDRKIIVKEIGQCGLKRPFGCSFNGTYYYKYTKNSFKKQFK